MLKVKAQQEKDLQYIKAENLKTLAKFESEKEQNMARLNLEQEQRIAQIKATKNHALVKIQADQEKHLTEISALQNKTLAEIKTTEEKQLKEIQLQILVNEQNLERDYKLLEGQLNTRMKLLQLNRTIVLNDLKLEHEKNMNFVEYQNKLLTQEYMYIEMSKSLSNNTKIYYFELL